MLFIATACWPVIWATCVASSDIALVSFLMRGSSSSSLLELLSEELLLSFGLASLTLFNIELMSFLDGERRLPFFEERLSFLLFLSSLLEDLRLLDDLERSLWLDSTPEAYSLNDDLWFTERDLCIVSNFSAAVCRVAGSVGSFIINASLYSVGIPLQ